MNKILYPCRTYNKPTSRVLLLCAFLFIPIIFTACSVQVPVQKDRDTSRLYLPWGNRPVKKIKNRTFSQKIDFLIVQLRHDDAAKRTGAATELGLLGPKAKSAIKPLTQVLWFDKDRWARRAAAKALGRVGGRAARESLLRGIHDIDKRVRQTSAEALQRIDTPQSTTGKPVITRYKAKGNKIQY